MDSDKELNIKDIINKTKNFDQPYAPAIPEGIHEVEVKSFEETYSKANNYKMLTLTVADVHDRTARVTAMLDLQFIEGTLRLIKGLYTHNVDESEKETAKEKINKFFDQAKDEADLQDKCVEILKKMVDKRCLGWLRVEFKNEGDKYPDRALTAYEPTYRWKTTADEAKEIIESGEPVEVDEIDEALFK